MGVVHGDGEWIDPGGAELAPAFGVEPVAPTTKVVHLFDRGDVRDLGKVVDLVAAAGFPVHAAEIGVAVGLDLAADLIRGRQPPDPVGPMGVVVCKQSLGVGSAPIRLDQGRFVVGQRHQLDVRQVHRAARERRGFIAGLHAGSRLP